ncbi:MAG: DAK2 domain-containing protein [Chloroflexota bacterium]|nr:DAK2 domain-containing protein [Chloroflexota bacterium]
MSGGPSTDIPLQSSLPLSRWGGPELLQAFAAATEWLAAHRDFVNGLNVFPIPDGDTGTNMVLTMRQALAEANAAGDDIPASAGEVAKRISHGSLMGARGNSGVILSQILRGFAAAIEGRAEMDGHDLAAALDGARLMAYKAVMQPVEGTMLTVIRLAAERAGLAAQRTPSLQDVLDEALRGAREALASTPDLLEILRQAGVVDAGGQGVVCILEGMDRLIHGQSVDSSEANGARNGGDMAFLDHTSELHGEDPFGYCTNFMVFGQNIDFTQFRDNLAGMGQSAVIVGDDRMVKVHIHALNPGKVLDYALGIGELGQIKIDNMQAQTDELTERRAQRVSQVPQHQLLTDQAIIAVAAGEGLERALRSMGATGIIAGGQTMNPSTEELLQAVEATPTTDVLLLPNNANILMAANQVARLTPKRVRVVPTRSVPQGLAALSAFNADADLDGNAREMEAAISDVRTVEVTRAIRDAEINGITVKKGQVLGLIDDRLVTSGDDEVTVACETLVLANLDTAELVTIFTGEGAGPDQAEALRFAIQHANPVVRVEVLAGDQPHYRFVIAVE